MTSRRDAGRVVLALVLTAVMASVAVAQTVPGAPTNVQATASGNNLTLTWAPPTSGAVPTSYTLLARVSAGAAPVAVIPLGAVTSFAAVAPNGTFLLSLTATNAAGTGPESATATVSFPGSVTAPGAPSALSVTVSGSTATFSWSGPSSGGAPASYLLLAGTTPGFTAPVGVLPLPAFPTSVAVPGVPAGTYYVRLLARNAGGTSGPSNEVTLSVAGPSVPGAPTLTATGTGNTLNLAWTPGSGGAPTSYTLIASAAPGGAPLATVPLSGTSVSFPNVPNGTYYLRLTASNSLGTSPASAELIITLPWGPIQQIGSDITGTDLNFGQAIALSANGARMVVAATGTTSTTGTTRVYERSGTIWTQIGGDIPAEAAGDQVNSNVDINAAGTRIAIGAARNRGGGAANQGFGHVRVFDLVGGAWTQVGADIDGPVAAGGFGFRVALSASGSRLIAGSVQLLPVGSFARVFDFVNGAWTQVGGTISSPSDFSVPVDISSDGSTVAVGAPDVASNGGPGSVRVYRLNSGNWALVGNVMSGNPVPAGQFNEKFGTAVSLSANGSRIVVSAPQRTPGGAGAGSYRGEVRVFDLVGSTWTQVGSSVSGVEVNGVGDSFGDTVGLSDDGSRFAASAAPNSVARVYTLSGGQWVQIGSNLRPTSTTAVFSAGLALAADGQTVAVGLTSGSPRRVSVFSILP